MRPWNCIALLGDVHPRLCMRWQKLPCSIGTKCRVLKKRHLLRACSAVAHMQVRICPLETMARTPAKPLALGVSMHVSSSLSRHMVTLTRRVYIGMQQIKESAACGMFEFTTT